MTGQMDLVEELDAIAKGHPVLGLDEYERIEAAIRAAAAAHAGVVNPNHVRALLTDPATGALTVNPRRLAARYNDRKLLEPQGEVRSTDTRGRNRGTWLNLYRLKAAS